MRRKRSLQWPVAVTAVSFVALITIWRRKERPTSGGDECFDPYSSDLYKRVSENCSAFRFIVPPNDGGRTGHVMSQLHMLFVLKKELDAWKVRTRRGLDVEHIPALYKAKESVLCSFFVRPPNTYMNLEDVDDLCGPLYSTYAYTDQVSWGADFEYLYDSHVLLETWPMMNMRIPGNSDVYQKIFQVIFRESVNAFFECDLPILTVNCEAAEKEGF
jgi:hypothetical protein